MKISNIHKAFVSNWVVFIACILAFLVFRLQEDWSNPNFGVITLIQVGIALFLLQLNNIFSIIRHRTLLPALFYLLLAGCNPVSNLDWKSGLVVLLMMVNYLFLFHAYQKPNSQLNALNISLILVLGSFLRPQLLLFFPVFWFGFYWFRSFNLRVFLASLIGIIIVYLIIFAWSIYQDDWQMFLLYLPKPEEIFFVYEPNLSNYELVNLGTVLFVYIFAGYNLYVSGISERIRTVSLLKYMYIFSFLILFMAFVQPEYRSFWELIAYISIAMVLAHYFTLTNKLSIKILMLIFIFGLSILGFLQHLST
ncbi:MAG: hypothetical protein LBC48_05010 [Dysgonamonadaceae bacterium]|jgi:hypothetical protein|nr:hypothetical protein [Dysgonamonadaceae bacterium]